MPILNGDIISVHYRGLCFGQRIILTTTYLNEGDWDLTQSTRNQLDIINESVLLAGTNPIVPAYLACLPNSYTLTEIRSQVIKPIRTAYESQPHGFIGTHEGAATVANDSACITLRAGLAGRSQVSNKHIGPIPDAVSASGLLLPGYVALLAVLAGRLLTPWNPLVGTGILRPAIIHGDPEQEPSLLISQVIGDQSRVQRRRTVRLGE